MIELEFEGFRPGYNFDSLDRGSRDELRPKTEVAVAQFITGAYDVLSGASPDVVTHQKNGYSQEGENSRDEIIHRLGLVFDFDLDEALSRSEVQGVVSITPWDKAQLGLDNPDEPSDVRSVFRQVSFCPLIAKIPVTVTEIEFPNTLTTSTGVRERTMRIISLTTPTDS